MYVPAGKITQDSTGRRAMACNQEEANKNKSQQAGAELGQAQVKLEAVD